MDLVQKGLASELGSFDELTVNMTWSSAADFDLAAIYETKKGTPGLVYFGEKGNLEDFPFIQLSDDAGVNDSAGDNQETLRITNLDKIKTLWIACWDYGQVKKGEPARFNGSDVKLSCHDNTGKSYHFRLDTGDTGNIAIIATVDNSEPLGPKIINSSRIGTLQELKKLEQLLDIVKAEDPDLSIELVIER